MKLVKFNGDNYPVWRKNEKRIMSDNDAYLYRDRLKVIRDLGKKGSLKFKIWEGMVIK